ncbi:MAG: ATP-dependent zinc metalloprotease FtsH [Parcubacteria group bacterium ADurb.Bin305]|nr:MAG: ATP-dependent zinc metalloprotease FtsH [Parcubacteria group bacterium ADurb.Bin305]
MKKIFSQILTVFIILLFLSLLIGIINPNFYSTSEGKVEKVSLSQALATLEKEGEVSKVIVKPNQLELILKNHNILIANKESGVSLGELLKDYNVPMDVLQAIEIEINEGTSLAFWLGLILPLVLPVIVFIWLFSSLFKRANQNASQVFSFSRSNVKLFSPKSEKEKITFKDVANLKEAKEELQEVVEFLKHSEKFEELGAKIPRGVLLAGAPGSGKTLLARAVAGEANVPFFFISGSEFIELFVGVGASRVRDAFTIAKKSAPSILFIDELDAIGRERGTGLGGGHDEREQTLNQILVEMDGFDRDTKVIVMAATNRPDILDAALLRPGRFDRRVILDLPDIKGREEVLKIHTRDKKLAPDTNLLEIAERTPGFSGADLANLVNEAAILAARRDKKMIEQSELIDSIEKVLLGPERKSRVLTTKEKEITAYHEAGHALVSGLVAGDNAEVRKVSIIPRGRAGGYTMRMPKEERYLKTRTEFLNDITILLGGYVAEELKFKDVSTGAANDLQEASDLSRSLVTKYGMSKTLGPVVFGKNEEFIFLGKDLTSERNYSEETAVKIDKEVFDIMKIAYQKAKDTLKTNWNKLEKIAQELIQKETLEKEEFEALIKE